MDYEALARGVLRELRGRRSQTAFSRRLGYGTNVAYAWEAGRRFPTAAELFRAATLVGVDVERAVAAFCNGRFPAALEGVDPASPVFAAGLLREVLRPAPITRLAERTGMGSSALSRTLSAKAQPRLPTYFRLFDAASRRLLDLLAGLVDLEAVPAARDEWRQLERLRQLAAHNPRFETVPRVLELEAYVHHRPGFVAERLGMSLAEEEEALRDLEAAGLLRWDGSRWQVDRERSVDTARFDPNAGQFLRAHWAEHAAERLRGPNDVSGAYLVFTTDDETLAAVRQLQMNYFRSLRALVASSPRSTRIAVANVHLFTIDDGPDTLGPPPSM